MNVLWIVVAAMSLLGLVSDATPGHASRRFTVEDDPVIEKIDEILPQSQYGQCGHPDYRPCAEVVNYNGKKTNRRVSDNGAVTLKIAELLNAEPQSLDGEASELMSARMVAVINENNCIGYAKCAQAYPVDAIIGATRTMHAVVSDLCMSCNLCVDPCPMYCTSLQPAVGAPNSRKWDLNTVPVHIVPVEHHT